MDLHLDDVAAIAAFVGTSGLYGARVDRTDDLPDDLGVQGDALYEAEGLRLAAMQEPDDETRAGGRWLVHPEEVAFRVRATRALADHWLAIANEQPTDDAVRAWRDRGFLEVTTPTEAKARFEAYLNAALRVYQPLVRWTMPTESIWESDGLKSSYQSVAAQLYNDMLTGETYRECANETCGRPFLRQRGRSKGQRSRSVGVIYCDRACARAQNERQRRRRAKEQRQ